MGSGEHVLEVQSATCIVHVGRVGEVPGEDNHVDDHEGDDDDDEGEYEDYEDYADHFGKERVDWCMDQPPLSPKSDPDFRDRQNLSLK